MCHRAFYAKQLCAKPEVASAGELEFTGGTLKNFDLLGPHFKSSQAKKNTVRL